MDEQPETHRLVWQGIEIEVRYWPLRWGVSAHLEIQSVNPERARLPITETGYRSHFHAPGTVEANGGDVVAQVRAWLDDGASNPTWVAYLNAGRQLSLF